NSSFSQNVKLLMQQRAFKEFQTDIGHWVAKQHVGCKDMVDVQSAQLKQNLKDMLEAEKKRLRVQKENEVATILKQQERSLHNIQARGRYQGIEHAEDITTENNANEAMPQADNASDSECQTMIICHNHCACLQ
ncbi:hypothetical protein PAXRUDRAFT_29329, partial [Paxillus rubicundulus Ve08.2h10]